MKEPLFPLPDLSRAMKFDASKVGHRSYYSMYVNKRAPLKQLKFKHVAEITKRSLMVLIYSLFCHRKYVKIEGIKPKRFKEK